MILECLAAAELAGIIILALKAIELNQKYISAKYKGNYWIDAYFETLDLVYKLKEQLKLREYELLRRSYDFRYRANKR